MKLHLPKLLLAAVVMACSVAQAEVTTATSITVNGKDYNGSVKILSASSDVTAENLTSADYVVVTPSRTELASSVLSTSTEGKFPTIIIAKYNTSTSADEVTPGEIFLNAANTKGIRLDNDFILGSCSYNDGALRLHEARTSDKRIVLTGTITLADNAEIGVSQGDFNYLEGAIQANGKTLEINRVGVGATLRLSGGGTIGTLTGNLDNIVFAATKSDGTTPAAGKNYTIGALTTTGSLAVEEGVTITLTGGDALTNGSKLLGMTGAGNITLSTTTALTNKAAGAVSTYTSQLTGKLTVNNGATLDLSDDRNDNLYKGNTYNLTSFSSVELDNGTIEFRGDGALKNLSVTSNGAEINVKDVKDNGGKLTLLETTTVNGKLSLSSKSWKSHVQIDKLSGGSKGEINCAVGSDNKDELTIKTIDGYSGKITGASKTLNLGLEDSDVLKFSAGSSVAFDGTINIKGQLAGASTISGSTINLANGASVSGNIGFSSAVNLSTVLNNTGEISFSGLNVNLDNISYELSYDSDEDYTGIQTCSQQYTYITGSGSYTNTGSLTFSLNGAAVDGVASDDGVFERISQRYNIASGDTVAASVALQATSGSGTGVSSVNVLGTMSGVYDDAWASEQSTVQVTGNGTVQVTGHLEKHNAKFAGFTGTILVDGNDPNTANGDEPNGGRIHLGTAVDAFSNSTIVLTGAVISGTTTERGYITGWRSDRDIQTFKQNIVLKGGAIKAENYSRWKSVTVDNADGATDTVSYYVAVGSGTGLTEGALNLNGGTQKFLGSNSVRLGGDVKFDGGVLDLNNLTVESNTKIANLQIVRGSTGEIKNGSLYVQNFDMRGNDDTPYGGTLTLTNANIMLDTNWSSGNGAKVLLEGNSSFTHEGAKISSTTESGQASIVSQADLNPQSFVSSEGVTITNATVTANNADMTISAKLKDSSVTNASSGSLTVADMTVTDASAKQSTLTGNMTVTKLTLASGLSETVAAVTTSGVLTLGSITLNLTDYVAGNYTLVSATDGGSINWTEGAWERTGTLSEGLTANVGMVNNVLQLTISAPEEEITSVNAKVTGVVGYDAATDMLTLQLDQEVTSGTMVSLTLITDEVLADIQAALNGADDMFRITVQYDKTHKVVAESFDQVVFYNEKGQGYWGEMVDYGGEVGTKLAYKLDRIPEPTTTTLSLLALSALAMRRRRK